MPPREESEAVRDAVKIAALAALYLLAARLGLSLEPVGGFASLAWPPAGIALFALHRFGLKLWPGVFIGALTANVLAGAPGPSALGIGCGNTLEAAAGVLLLRWAEFDDRFSRVRDVGVFVVVGGLTCNALAATIGVATLSAGGVIAPGAVDATWGAWWLGDGLGVLTVTPLLMLWSRREAWRFSPERAAEAAIVFAFLAALALTVFVGGHRGSPAGPLRPFLIFPALYWASLRFSQKGATSATFLLSLIALGGTLNGLGPFAASSLPTGLSTTQVFIGVSAVTALMLAAAIAERDEARAALEARLESSRFLARASALLSSSLDYEATLQAVATLVVPRLGDICMVDVRDADGAVRRVADAAATRDQAEVLRELRRFPPAGPTHPAVVAMETGKTLHLPALTEELIRRAVPDDALAALIRGLEPSAVLIVPLVSHGRTLGALTLGLARSRRQFRADDLALAEELAGRAAVAIDHALTYRAQVRASAEAGEALKVREDFLAVAGHELKTPLTSLLLQVQGLQRALGRGAQVDNLGERLERAAGAGLRLEVLIDQLLDVSRITAGRLQLEPEALDLEQLLREVAERFHEQAQRAGSALHVATRGPLPGRWDRLRLEQVLSNLLGNAVKYGEGKPIDVELSEEAGAACVRVVDRGIGIEPAMQQRIFERFERAVGSREFGGFGLGLWIARQIVEASGGTISVESAPGRGSTFTLRLPLEPREALHVVH